MDAEHTHLLLHTEARWLLKVDCWPEFLSYKDCSRDFFFKKGHRWQHISITPEWVTKLPSLCDIFNLLNKFSLSLQEKMPTVFKSADKVASLKVKLELWEWWVIIEIFNMFQVITEILKETELVPSFSQLVRVSAFKRVCALFPNHKRPQSGKEWICDLFVNKPGKSNFLC